jgi:ribosomal protein S18 acetylase RimI-like enzyme
MELSFSLFIPEDYQELYEFWKKIPGISLNQSDSYEQTCGFAARNQEGFILARAKGKIVGSIMAGHDGRRGYLYHVAVDPIFRNKGVGRELVQRALTFLKKNNIVKTHLFVLNENLSAKIFWNKQGFLSRNDIAIYSWDKN